MLGAAVLVSHAGDIFTVGRQQRTNRNSDRAAELSLNGLAQILQDVKTIGDLPRLRRAFLRPLGERPAAIAADNLDAGMLLEPVRSHARGAFWK